jgi:hypothetical protein
MAVKICRICLTPKTVQPYYGSEKSYWTCMKCCKLGHYRKPAEEPMLLLITSTEYMRAA